MLKHLDIKHILFYVIAIASVVGLFNYITAYARVNIKASPKLSGIYPLEAKSLSECLQDKTLILKIQQSGVYLNGVLMSIYPEDLATAGLSGDEELPLVGHFKDSQVTLKGKVAALKGCPSADSQGQIIVKAIGQEQKLTGVLTSGGLSLPFETVANNIDKKTPDQKAH